MENLKKKVQNKINGTAYMKLGNETFIYVNGYRDNPNKILINEETKFGVASINKVFVAVGILKLIEKEVLTFETTLHDIFGKIGKLNRDTTVKQLLTHTSNVPDYFDEDVMEEYSELWKNFPNYNVRKNSDIFPLFINNMPKPNTEFCYNNSGYILLAEIIEKITDEKFDDYLQKNIFDKIKMYSTGYFELDSLPENTANGYINKTTTNIYSIDVKGTGAGGAFTTTKDLKIFWDELFSGNLLGEDMLKLMLSPEFSGVQNYGLGVWLRQVKIGNKQYSVPFLQGSDPGVNALSLYDREHRFQLTILSNMEGEFWSLGRDILEYIYE